MDYNKLDKKIITSWRISRIIRLVIIAIVLSIPIVILSFQSFFSVIAIYVYLIGGIILIYLIVAPILYPIIEYRQWGYIITEDRVEIKHGIFFIDTTVIPIIRIQHITITQGPINRNLGLSTVVIRTASGSFTIQGLSNDDARAIMDTLKAKLYTRLEAHGKV